VSRYNRGSVQSLNIDLGRPLSDDNRETLNQALVDHGVLFIREQTLTPEQDRASMSAASRSRRGNWWLNAVISGSSTANRCPMCVD
jgi:alpha-ketoglutarate-dependent taurine dioxygenase